MSQKIIFKYGNNSSLPATKVPGQVLFAIQQDGTGNIYFDKDASTRIKMGLGTEGGTINGTLLFQNTNKTGHLKLYGSSEGGNIQIQGPSNKFYWEMDALNNNQLRLYCHDIDNNANYGFWTWNSDKSTTFPGKITTSELVVSTETEYPKMALKSTKSTNQAITYSGNINTNKLYAQVFYEGTNGKREYYKLPDYTNGRTEDGPYEILTTKNSVAISQGGTGATTAAGALTNLGAVSKSGSTIDSQAFFAWADAGHFNQSGVSYPYKYGGLRWNGESDGVDLFAEETGSDNLDLIIQFKDDNSNKLQIRNSAGNKTLEITANGRINAYSSSSSGWASMWTDNEGGNWEIRSKSGTHKYQFDAVNDSTARLISFVNDVHSKSWFFNGETGAMSCPGTFTANTNSTWAIKVNQTNTSGESSICYSVNGTEKWVLGQGVGGSSPKFGLWNCASGLALIFNEDSSAHFYSNLGVGGTLGVTGDTNFYASAGVHGNLSVNGYIASGGTVYANQVEARYDDDTNIARLVVRNNKNRVHITASANERGFWDNNYSSWILKAPTGSNLWESNVHTANASYEFKAHNSSQAGHFRGGVDGEGGYWEVKSKTGLYSYQFDAYQDTGWRLYAWDNTANKYAADLTFDTVKNRLVAHKLRLTSTADASETQNTDVAFTIGPEDSQHLIIDNNEILSKTSASTMGDLYLQGLQIQSSGSITRGTWNASTIAVARGGTGATTASGACTNIGAVNKSGDTMTGTLTVKADGLIVASRNNSDTKDGGHMCFQSGNYYSNKNITVGAYKGGLRAYTYTNSQYVNLFSAYEEYFTAPNFSTTGYVASGDNMYANYMIARRDNSTVEAACIAKNNNGEIRLSVENARGIWDHTGGKWILNANANSNDWHLNVNSININGTTNITGIIYSTSQPAGQTGKIWLKPIN